MFKKTASSVKMTYDISDAEKMYAEHAILAFNKLLVGIRKFVDHLDKMSIPFKGNVQVPPEQIWKAKTTFRNYRDESTNNLNNVKKLSFDCVKLMNNFMSDTQVEKIMKSFNMAIDDVTKQFDRFTRLFENLQDKDFISNCITAIDAVKKETAQLNQIIDERIKSYIENEILAKSWVDSVGDFNLQMDDKVPFEKELLEAQKEKLQKS